MKTTKVIKCARCGRKFDGKINIFEFQCADGTYMACERCMARLGLARTEVERLELIEQFKVVENVN